MEADGALTAETLPTTLISLAEFERFGYEPLIDEPVTGAGNDDLWTQDCEPDESGSCPGGDKP